MALSNLKSAYSFYTKTPPGFKPNDSVNDTDFQYKDDLTAVTVEAGFTNYGSLIRFRNRRSKDDFTISGQGTSTRIQQLGTGTKFPIGPKGQVHDFDILRGGFSLKNKYQDSYGPLLTAGLADTYTKDSPIDDMYNIVKVRDVASRRAYAREPFILRGIQRNDNSDPQRFGPTITADIPRGGLLTNLNRTALDVARLAKFSITPKGLLFHLKQFGQQLMNPNVENVFGEAPRNPFLPNSTKLYTPINLMANVIGADKGLRFRRHGLLPAGSNKVSPGRYEDVHKFRDKPDTDPKANNRLKKLSGELGIETSIERQIKFVDAPFSTPSLTETLTDVADKAAAIKKSALAKLGELLGFKGQVINTLTGITGPASIGGLGRTTIRRAVDTPNEQQKFKELHGKDNYKPIQSDASKENTKKLKGEKDAITEKYKSGLAAPVEKTDFDGISIKKPDPDPLTRSKPEDQTPLIAKYKTLSYGQISKEATKRTTNKKGVFDFRTNKKYDYGTDTPIDDIIGKGLNNDHEKDIIETKIVDSKLGTMRFLSYITNLSDSLGQDIELDDIAGTGNLEKGAKQNPITRQISLGLIVSARNAEELSTIYKTLEKYRSMIATPSDRRGRTKLTVGNFLNNLDIYPTTIETGWDTEYTFDLTEKVPYTLNIDLEFLVEKASSRHYSLGYKG